VLGTDIQTQPPTQPQTASTRVYRPRRPARTLLLARIYECLPLSCPRCGQPMRIIAFVLDPPVIQRILGHIGEPTTPPAVSPARSPPQVEINFDQAVGADGWPEIDQTAGAQDDTWN